jgi:autotransporter adhesin
MKKKLLVLSILAVFGLPVASFAASYSTTNSSSNPATTTDAGGDMATGDSASASGTTVTQGEFVQTQNGSTTNVYLPNGATSQQAISTAVGTDAVAGKADSTQTVYGGDTAVGPQANATGYESTAVGSEATTAGNSGATAVGANAEATMLGTAVGTDAASNTDGTAIGSQATAGVNGTATGANSAALGQFATATGNQSSASAYGTTADGAAASASALQSTALGAGSSATGNNSVAVGQGSTANRADSFSVGSDTNDRQITHVAAGTQATDAANVGQLNALGQNFTGQLNAMGQNLQAQFARDSAGILNSANAYTNKKMDQIGALSAASTDAAFAAAGLRGINRIAAGVGEMGGQTGEAIAYQHVFSHHWDANVTVAFGAGTQVGVGAGYSW